MLRIGITDHAAQRWQERLGPLSKREIANAVRPRLRAALKLGVETNRFGGVEIDIGSGVRAVLYPSMMGGWELVTVYVDREGEREIMPQSRSILQGQSTELKNVLERVARALREVKYGEVVIKVQGGKVIWIDKYERERVQ